ncbi:MAG: winged helix-turn-helix transcriptional regulator [Rhodobiaceae bacterium]|nr:winged helix-turn-helix transcriptional regulator [Rhodobiaceae bacterium]
MDPISILAALAEPTRLRAVQILADGSEHCVCELMQKLAATQSRMSRHMQVLKQAGLVSDRRDAQWVRYRLDSGMDSAQRALVDAALRLAETRDAEREAA